MEVGARLPRELLEKGDLSFSHQEENFSVKGQCKGYTISQNGKRPPRQRVPNDLM
jgi:hypothetical protein